MSARERIVVTGMGAVSALGAGKERLFAGVLAGRSGISAAAEASAGHPAARVECDLERALTSTAASGIDRHVALALVAADEALSDAGIGAGSATGAATGVYWGTGVGSAATTEDGYRRILSGQRLRPLTIVFGMQNAAVAQLAIEFGLRGPQVSVSQACASAAVAIGEAFFALRAGRAERIVVGGSEAPVVAGQLEAWSNLRVLAPRDADEVAGSCRPFDRRRRGLVLGEGAAALVLEREDVARRRGAKIYAELAGYGNVGDASNYARPDADGQTRAMLAALAEADLAPRSVGYVNAHATGTSVGDACEAAAIRAVFGEGGDRPLVSSTKGAHGHTLGAAGAIEAVITVLALAEASVPPSTNLLESDVSGIDLVIGEARRAEMEAALSNTFAFGGSNASLLFRRLH